MDREEVPHGQEDGKDDAQFHILHPQAIASTSLSLDRDFSLPMSAKPAAAAAGSSRRWQPACKKGSHHLMIILV
jgi:hypothetical protein